MSTPPPDALSRTIYDALHSLAERLLVEQRKNHTLQPTALVHEAYLRLQRLNGEIWCERARFLALAGKTMRSVLVDHARRRAAKKRGSGASGIQTVFEDPAREDDPIDVLDLEDALVELEKIDEGLVRVVEMLFFAGLSSEEAGGVLGVSERTVKRAWRTARTWLKARLDASAPGS